MAMTALFYDVLKPAGKSVIKESRHSHLARHFDEVDCEAQLKKTLVRQDVRRRNCGVAVCHEAARDETLGKYSGQYGEEVKGAGDPGLETRRGFDRLLHCAWAHIRSSHNER